MKYHILINNKQHYELLLQCVRKSYLQYGQELADEDVYSINSEIDEVMQQLKKAEYK